MFGHTSPKFTRAIAVVSAVGGLLCAPAHASDVSKEEIKKAAALNRGPYLTLLRSLVEVESGSRDLEGLAKIAGIVRSELAKLGGSVSVLPGRPVYPLSDSPAAVGDMVKAEFSGKGTRKIMFIAHMDTVYLRGMLARQPFKVDGDTAYGLAIADDKQGVALIIRAIAMMKELGIDDYGKLTVLINGDEEISSPGSRETISKLAAEQDALFSFEVGGPKGDIRLATSGVGAVQLSVEGKSSHAGARPEAGANALTELVYQLSKLEDLSVPSQGLKVNWTLAQAGTNRNVIPANASAQADVRANRVSDFDTLEEEIQARTQQRKLAQSRVDVKFEVRRPPLEATDAAREIAKQAQQIYAEIGHDMPVKDQPTGGGTDAAFAGLHARGAVIEGFGLTGTGAHSNNDERIDLKTLEPRLYLIARLVQVLGSLSR
ncbi:M20/M25/M40 family metallo-hydrolase (plasmid) [Cupriavidus necator]|uniref:M20/M25/M40 family metallo-hydrolase n=1 Tax=Cupriavidus necator TaxID=106590 RepID=A0A367P7T3_CUPNE|nr:glutamate carboxypeptidase [Cupriavidus necator]QQX89290.1 M20/M25/M40 family metallo-hydrolase [Cupriavidus necator]RCJ03573.1 M20/M25/M40 family metallo-hydrolase [Cupriavidus necator]